MRDLRPEEERIPVAYRIVYDVFNDKIARTCMVIDPKDSMIAATEPVMAEATTSGVQPTPAAIENKENFPEEDKITSTEGSVTSSDSDLPMTTRRKRPNKWDSEPKKAVRLRQGEQKIP